MLRRVVYARNVTAIYAFLMLFHYLGNLLTQGLILTMQNWNTDSGTAKWIQFHTNVILQNVVLI